MTTQTHGGFTIIEVMLFLAVTGALAVSILVGSGVAIGQQRYRDSVNSFKSLIQEQYGQITNVVNSDREKPICVESGGTLSFDEEADPQARGTSDCLVIGRFMFISGNMVTTYNVIGQPPESSTDTNDTDILRECAVGLHSPEEHKVSWRARIVEPGTSNDSITSVAMIRSPLSGSILTYVLNGDHRPDPIEMIDDANMIEKNFCVDSDGQSAMANRLAVRINARAANPGAVEIPLERDGVCA